MRDRGEGHFRRVVAVARFFVAVSLKNVKWSVGVEWAMSGGASLVAWHPNTIVSETHFSVAKVVRIIRVVRVRVVAGVGIGPENSTDSTPVVAVKGVFVSGECRICRIGVLVQLWGRIWEGHSTVSNSGLGWVCIVLPP